MEIQTILSKVPRETRIYVFGSKIHSEESPNDLDILITYSSKSYPKTQIFDNCEEFINCLSQYCGLIVDVTFLSYDEASEVSFVKNAGAIPLEVFLNKYDW